MSDTPARRRPRSASAPAAAAAEAAPDAATEPRSPRDLLAAAWDEAQRSTDAPADAAGQVADAAPTADPPAEAAPAEAAPPAEPASAFGSGQSRDLPAAEPSADAAPADPAPSAAATDAPPAAADGEPAAPAETDDEPLEATLPRHPAEGRDEPVEMTPLAIVEAILFATDLPLPAAKIAEIAELDGAGEVKKLVTALNDRYRAHNAAFRIENLAGGYQLLSLPHFNPWLSRLRASRAESRLSASALETLALVAYKQPVTRADVEAIRGVACGEVLRTLMERGLVKMAGRAEEVGRPMLYATTRKFLRVFGLSSLKDLPAPEKPVKQDRPPPPAEAVPSSEPATQQENEG